MWNRIRSCIVAEALREMKPEVTEDKREVLYRILEKDFLAPPGDMICKNCPCEPTYFKYDVVLFTAVCNFIHNPQNGFECTPREPLTVKEFQTIECAIDTVFSFILHCIDFIPNFVDRLKLNLACQLSSNYDLATEEAISRYEQIFTGITHRLKREVEEKENPSKDIVDEVYLMAENIDPVLFSNVLLYIRAQLANTSNYRFLK